MLFFCVSVCVCVCVLFLFVYLFFFVVVVVFLGAINYLLHVFLFLLLQKVLLEYLEDLIQKGF